MKRREQYIRVLNWLASMPFVDRLELAALCDTPHRSLYDAIARLEREGMMQSVPHATELIAPTGRYCLTAAGLQRLVQDACMDIGLLLRTRPVSARWQRILMQHLHAVAVIYRVAADIARKLGTGEGALVSQGSPGRRVASARWAHRRSGEARADLR